jgi:hypothetical protein
MAPTEEGVGRLFRNGNLLAEGVRYSITWPDGHHDSVYRTAIGHLLDPVPPEASEGPGIELERENGSRWKCLVLPGGRLENEPADWIEEGVGRLFLNGQLLAKAVRYSVTWRGPLNGTLVLGIPPTGSGRLLGPVPLEAYEATGVELERENGARWKCRVLPGGALENSG